MIMSRVALLTECLPYDSNYYSRMTLEQKFSLVGGNTGNNAYLTALVDIFDAKYVHYSELDNCLREDMYDIYIVGNLSWILENTPLPDYYYPSFKKIIASGKKFIPISVGTQVANYKSKFEYHVDTLKFLKDISEQAVIACRGSYTAEQLYQNGIKNIEVIGCPSLYHTKNPNFSIRKPNKWPENPSVATGITPWPNGRLTAGMIKEYFDYVMKHRVDYVIQTRTNWIDPLCNSDKDFKMRIEDYLKNYSKLFFNIREWREYSKKLNFSFSGRFHGNVIPLLEGVPSLFIIIDGRTQEMCEYFKLPAIDITNFDFNKPLDYYYEITDYTEFNKNYRNFYYKFEEFSRRNNLHISY